MDRRGRVPSSRASVARVPAVVFALLSLRVLSGRALAHPGHDGAAAEPGTWLVYGPVLLGAVTVTTAAALGREGAVSAVQARALGTLGVALLVGGLFAWVA